jgi:hypothetical protein
MLKESLRQILLQIKVSSIFQECNSGPSITTDVLILLYVGIVLKVSTAFSAC